MSKSETKTETVSISERILYAILLAVTFALIMLTLVSSPY